MVVVFLKNGEKAPLPDATHVRIESMAEPQGMILRCFFNEQEVGQFKWDEVAGYSIGARSDYNIRGSYDAWNSRLEAGAP